MTSKIVIFYHLFSFWLVLIKIIIAFFTLWSSQSILFIFSNVGCVSQLIMSKKCPWIDCIVHTHTHTYSHISMDRLYLNREFERDARAGNEKKLEKWNYNTHTHMHTVWRSGRDFSKLSTMYGYANGVLRCGKRLSVLAYLYAVYSIYAICVLCVCVCVRAVTPFFRIYLFDVTLL